MRLPLLMAAAALAFAAGCERGAETASPYSAPAPASGSSAPSSPPPSSAGSASGGATTSTTPANIGQPSSVEEKKEGTNPVQQQVDPKQAEQRRDFQQRGDAAGPTSPDTQPKN